MTSVCVEGDLAAAYNAESFADTSACGTTFTSGTVAGAGSVTYGAGNFKFDATMQMTMSLAYTPACVSALSGGGVLNASTCSQAAANHRERREYLHLLCQRQHHDPTRATVRQRLRVDDDDEALKDATTYEFNLAWNAQDSWLPIPG